MERRKPPFIRRFVVYYCSALYTASTLWIISGMPLAAVLIWQGFTVGGNPDPLAPHTDATAAVLDISVLVFREFDLKKRA